MKERHAFFCFLIESELKKRNAELEMFINNWLDLEFYNDDRIYCINIETWTNLARGRGGRWKESSSAIGRSIVAHIFS